MSVDTEKSNSVTSLHSESSREERAEYQEVPLDLRTVTAHAVSHQMSRLSRSESAVSETVLRIMSQDSTKAAKYSRFSDKTKVICLICSAMSGFLSPLTSLTILPAIPEIALRFNTTEEVINVSNAVYCIFMSLSPCLFSPCSDIYGRRPMFLICSVMFCVSNALVAVSQNLAMFFIFRCSTALFGTSFFSIGGHIVGDIYHPTQRGRAMASLVAGAQVGTGLGPFIGGVIVTYTSWRVILWFMMGMGAIVLIIAVFFLPETAETTEHAILLEEARKENPKRSFYLFLLTLLRL